MEKQQIKKVNDANRIILENTFALSQIAKLFCFIEKKSSIAEENQEIIDKPENIFKKGYKNYEVYSEHKMTL
jgi:hypothetical protein